MHEQVEREIIAILRAQDWASILGARNLEVTQERSDSDQLRVDVVLDSLISGFLPKLIPSPVLSEESLERTGYSPLQSDASFWLVDPLDGTREFRNGVPEYAVSIAYVERGIPIAGAIYNPARDEFFTSTDSNYRPPTQLAGAAQSGAYLFSRSEHAAGLHQAPRALPALHFPVGSVAYKLGILSALPPSAGLVSYRPKNCWDIAAGAAILRNRLGKELTTLAGGSISYRVPFERIPSLLVQPS